MTKERNKPAKNIPNIIFIGFLAAVLLVAASVIIFTNWRPGDYRRFDQLETTNENDWLTIQTSKSGTQNDYLVFIYNKESKTLENEIIINKLIDYANYSRHNKTAPKLYILDFDGDYTGKIKEHIKDYTSDSNLPFLTLISDQKVKTIEKKVSSILTYLDSKMI